MRVKYYMGTILVALAVSMSSAYAQTTSMLDVLDIDLAGNKPNEAFKILDQNGNGAISSVEWRLRILTIFFKKDGDEDGFLDRKDIPGISDTLFAQIDMNGDGRIAASEWTDRRTVRHSDIDKNKDGSISLDELKAFAKK